MFCAQCPNHADYMWNNKIPTNFHSADIQPLLFAPSGRKAIKVHCHVSGNELLESDYR